MGHGKIEALNRFIRSAFLAELKSSRVSTLDALNEAFLAWMVPAARPPFYPR